MSGIKIESTTYTDTLDKIHVIEGGVVCCNKPLQMLMHLDGEDFYTSTYECECGNIIHVNIKRELCIRGAKKWINQ